MGAFAIYRSIPLTRGKVTWVDQDDYEMLRHWTWNASKSGYAQAYNGGGLEHRRVNMHRVIMLPEPGQQVDHVNSDGLDNRRFNLRICTHSQNNWNQRKTRGVSRYKGVWWHRKGHWWSADIGAHGIRHRLGHFDSEEAAARAYDTAAHELHGEFARLNFPEECGVEAERKWTGF